MKYTVVTAGALETASRPIRGAWIEIPRPLPPCGPSLVAPHTGRVD